MQRFEGNFYFYDGLKQEYLKITGKVVYVRGYGPRVTPFIPLFYDIPSLERERAERK